MPAPPQLSVDVFPAWALLNRVQFANAKLQHIDGKGFGIVAERDLQYDGDGGDGDSPVLLRIPHDLVLSARAVEEYAKVDQNFRQLLDVVEHQSPKENIRLYLLTQLVRHTRDHATSPGGVPTPWTQYVNFLPRSIPVPTMWNEMERSLLNGTSLETTLAAKLSALAVEFAQLRDKSSDLPFWNCLLWEDETATLDLWILVDAWYRSRSLELPWSGDSMVPWLDMANHSHQPTAYYEEISDDIVVLLRPSSRVTSGEEITLSYGEAKSAAEMLFSYGFIDKDSVAQTLALPLKKLSDDPLVKCKLHMSKAPPILRLSRTDGTMKWECPCAYLLVLNEEDGLRFRVLQDVAGGRQLRLFWQDEDVTERADEFETLIRDHPLCQVFRLRVVAILHELVSESRGHLGSTSSGFSHDRLQSYIADGQVRAECVKAAEALRESEASLLEEAYSMLEEQMTHLLADDHVVAYLGSKEAAQNEQAAAVSANEDDEFS